MSDEKNADPLPWVRTYNGTNPKRIADDLANSKPKRFENGFGEIVVTVYAPRPEFGTPTPATGEDKDND